VRQILLHCVLSHAAFRFVTLQLVVLTLPH